MSLIFYRVRSHWIESPHGKGWKDIRLFVFLNHTSLYEILFIGAVPTPAIWRDAPRMVVPGADKTLNRPVVGRFFKLLFPKIVSITRKRDNSWSDFLSGITPDSVIAIAPEGRMMRANGLDSDGKPMTIRGGIAEVLQGLGEGVMIIGYSGGLHHVQIPDQGWPKPFKTIQINFERLKIEDYIAQFEGEDFKQLVVEDLERRKKQYCPT